MKRYVLLPLFLLTAATLFAQQDTTLIYSNPGYNKDPLRSKWRKEVVHKDSLWVVMLYNGKDELRERISYGDEKLSVRSGPYAFYENGKLVESGDFDKGYKYGEWKVLFPNEQVHEKANYAWNTLHGNYRLYWDNGHVRKEGRYSRGKKVGNWRMFHQNGKLALKENYDDNGQLTEGEYFDAEGKHVAKTEVVSPPNYKGGLVAFYQLFARSFKYPANLPKEEVPAKINIDFEVTSKGRITAVGFPQNTSPKLKREILKVLALSLGNWVPGTELGEAVDMQYILPLEILLQQ